MFSNNLVGSWVLVGNSVFEVLNQVSGGQKKFDTLLLKNLCLSRQEAR